MKFFPPAAVLLVLFAALSRAGATQHDYPAGPRPAAPAPHLQQGGPACAECPWDRAGMFFCGFVLLLFGTTDLARPRSFVVRPSFVPRSFLVRTFPSFLSFISFLSFL